MKATFPNVTCDHHPGAQAGMAVCLHVFEGERRAFHVEHPDSTNIGVILCKQCNRKKDITADDLRLVCIGCARERGWIGFAV